MSPSRKRKNPFEPADRALFSMAMAFGAMLCGPVGWCIWLSALSGAKGPAPRQE